MSDLGGGIDKFELDLLEVLSLVVDVERLSKADRALSYTHARSLDHEEIVLDLSVMREAADGVDRLYGDVDGGGAIVQVNLAVLGLVTSSQSVNLLVDLHSVVETLLTTSSNSVADSRWMPSTNTSYLSQTTMCLSRQLLGTPSTGYTLSSMTLGSTNAVQVVVLSKNVTNTDLLLK